MLYIVEGYDYANKRTVYHTTGVGAGEYNTAIRYTSKQEAASVAKSLNTSPDVVFDVLPFYSHNDVE